MLSAALQKPFPYGKQFFQESLIPRKKIDISYGLIQNQKI